MFLGRVFLSDCLRSSRISRVISLNVFSLFLADIFHISAGFRNLGYFLNQPIQWEGNALYILRIISRSEYTRDGLDTSPQFIAFFSEVFVVEDGA